MAKSARDKAREEKKHAKKLKHNSKRKLTDSYFFILAIIVVLVYILSFAAKVIFFEEVITLIDIFYPILEGLIGSLPVALFIDIMSARVLSDVSSEVISTHIASTLMGDLDVLNEFDIETRKNFIKSTISSLTGKYNTRKYENYYISVQTDLFTVEETWKEIFTADKYISIEENLQYIKHFGRLTCDDLECFPQDFYIAFCLFGKDADEKFRDQKCMFREYLFISEEDMRQLCDKATTETDKSDFVHKCLNLQVEVHDTDKENEEKATIREIEFSESGIYIGFHSTHDVTCRNVLFKLRFVMPQLIGHIEVIVQVGEPTFCPAFTFIYPKNSKLRTFLHMTGSEQISVKDTSVSETIWSLQLQNQWVYPMSGITFSLELPSDILK